MHLSQFYFIVNQFMFVFFQEQGHNIVLSDAESTFHAIKVPSVQLDNAFPHYLSFSRSTTYFLFKLVSSDIYHCSCRHLAKVTGDGVMTQTALNLAHLLLVIVLSDIKKTLD